MRDPDSGGGAPPVRGPRSLTSRRGFIAATSLGAVSLYGLWAAHDAAPLRLFGGGAHDGHAAGGEAAGHGGHGAARGPTPDEFRRQVEEFVARHRQADGSVRVEGAAPAADEHAGHGAGHAMPAVAAPDAPADVFLLAQQWSFEPAMLRLRAGVPYRFQMMAVDASHGASLQLGRGSRIVRLRRGVPVEQELTFTRPGTYLLYCTIYCGIGHDRMSATILVA